MSEPRANINPAEWRNDLATNRYWSDKPTAKASIHVVLTEVETLHDLLERLCEAVEDDYSPHPSRGARTLRVIREVRGHIGSSEAQS